MKRPTKKGSLSAGSGFSKPMTKQIQFGKTKYTARHVIVAAQDVEKKTVAHHLNTRHQESLSMDAVRDIYPQVLAEGIKQEGVAYYNEALDRYELFDASRRRFCAIEAKVDLPLWVLSELPEGKDIIAYVDLTQTVKLLSWREVGTRYLNYANENDIEINDYDRLGKEFSVSGETIRKKVNAATLSKVLVESFPDCQGIPTSFYSKLGKIERAIKKLGTVAIDKFVQNATDTFQSDAKDVGEVQQSLLSHYEVMLEDFMSNKPKAVSSSEDLATFDDRNKFARKKVSANGRKITLEFSRLPKEVMVDIEAYIRDKLNSKH
ncbi:ParB family protein [Vibrio sp. WXL103]|uniref:ParB family protein n=1 Tax=Vibrio sp. WXL103 TaxID=3450710 RepID=UPI003EC72684